MLIAAQAGKLTHISAEISGYTGKNISFGFVEEAALTMDYPYVENRLMEFEVELEDITMMKINGWICICLQPGDSIHAKITYTGNVYRTVEYSGSPSAVIAADFLHQIRELRNQRRYKASFPAALVVGTESKDYYEETRKEWKDELNLLKACKGQLSENYYNYLKSQIEGELLTNLLVYPYVYADALKKDLSQVLPENYWEVLNHYSLREDAGSLRNRLYVSFLFPYKAYMKAKKAGTGEADYAPVKDLEKEFTDIVGFYDGNLRDAALFALLFNAIGKGKELKSVERLKKEYLKKYNLNKSYKITLNEMMR